MRDLAGVTGKSHETGSPRSRDRLIVFIICLGISVIIWFLITVSKESFTTIEYPVIFENNPMNYVLSGKPDSIISFSVSSGGLDLLILRYFSNKIPIKVDLTNVIPHQEGDYCWASIPASEFSNQVLSRLNLTEEHISIKPEYLNLRFEKVSGKKVRVIPRLKLTFAKQFMLSDSLKAFPDSVVVQGQKDIIDKIPLVFTESLEISNISSTQTVKALLVVPDVNKDIKVIPESVNVEIPVDEFTESRVEIPVASAKPELKIRTFPEKVAVVFNVGLKDFNRVNPDMFHSQVEVDPAGHPATLKVNIVRSPSFVQIVRTEPEYVEYLILK